MYINISFFFCRECFVGLNGANFSSPSFPDAYPENLRCVWTFSTSRNFRLLITFDFINTEQDYDFINVEEEQTESLLLKWSGGPTNGTPTIHSQNNDIVVKFSTDYSVNSEGFFGRVEISSLFQTDFVCADNNFDCGNGVCIPKDSECDSEQNCGNAEDDPSRRACDLLACTPPFSFRCLDGSCISESSECDGIEDCLYGDDEPKTCNSDCDGQFRCLDSSCVPLSWVCDGSPDCFQREDEYDCECLIGFQCSDGLCIPPEYECDGQMDCTNGEDEPLSCPCTETEFTCDDGSCISSTWQCDGEDDCRNGEDETELLCGPICAGDIVANYELDCRFDGVIAPGIWKPPMCTEPAIGTYPSECLPHPSSICQDQETKHVTCICPYTYGKIYEDANFA
ncbi:putative suppressor of tumorigenicity 14 protein-like [Apostichopus japonicus]|uniref:Putative suppressor of tumorigenicity 14 protein-like n=1 Tax=Stichopus japonicus TaxID=307972 RepID=A0A2G8LFB6_STIJA|nr:putative suppressor of tumorigenicity 14 protein-like [Apostichopus japonicus]